MFVSKQAEIAYVRSPMPAKLAMEIFCWVQMTLASSVTVHVTRTTVGSQTQ